MSVYSINGIVLVTFFIIFMVNASGSFPASAGNIAVVPLSVSHPLQESTRNASSSATFSEKISDLSETGLRKIKSGITSVINNVYNRTQDFDNIILGAPCTSDSNCSTVRNANCDRGMCNCGANYTVATKMPDQCLKVVRLSEICEEDRQCSKNTTGAICAGFRCVCSDLYAEERGRCIPKRMIGSPCNVKKDCALVPFADCNSEGVCACPKPFTSSVHNNACLTVTITAEESTCQEDKQCLAVYGNRTACVHNICTCDHGYHPYDGKCLPDLKLGNTCTKLYDCIVSKFTEAPNLRECYNNTCVCKPGYTISDNTCMKGYGYQLHASLAWLLCIFILPYLF